MYISQVHLDPNEGYRAASRLSLHVYISEEQSYWHRPWAAKRVRIPLQPSVFTAAKRRCVWLCSMHIVRGLPRAEGQGKLCSPVAHASGARQEEAEDAALQGRIGLVKVRDLAPAQLGVLGRCQVLVPCAVDLQGTILRPRPQIFNLREKYCLW